jgi:hypothetical protein
MFSGKKNVQIRGNIPKMVVDTFFPDKISDFVRGRDGKTHIWGLFML